MAQTGIVHAIAINALPSGQLLIYACPGAAHSENYRVAVYKPLYVSQCRRHVTGTSKRGERAPKRQGQGVIALPPRGCLEGPWDLLSSLETAGLRRLTGSAPRFCIALSVLPTVHVLPVCE